MRRILDSVILLASCALGLAALRGDALASTPDPWQPPRSGHAGELPLLGGLAGLGFYWLWRRLGGHKER